MVYVLLGALALLLLVCIVLYRLFRSAAKDAVTNHTLAMGYYSSLSEKDQRFRTLVEELEANHKKDTRALMDMLTNSHASEIDAIEKKLIAQFTIREAGIRKDAIERAKVVNKGFDGETFSPLLQDKWMSKDFRHIGDPIDFLVLAGAEYVRSDLQEEIDSITLLEIKTGGADMNKVQRRIRDAVVANKVQFALYNPDTKVTRIWSHENPKGKDNEQRTTPAPVVGGTTPTET